LNRWYDTLVILSHCLSIFCIFSLLLSHWSLTYYCYVFNSQWFLIWYSKTQLQENNVIRDYFVSWIRATLKWKVFREELVENPGFLRGPSVTSFLWHRRCYDSLKEFQSLKKIGDWNARHWNSSALIILIIITGVAQRKKCVY